MKKIYVLFLLALLPLVTHADPVEINGIYYTLVSKAKVAEVTENPNKYTGDIVIPKSFTYNGITYNVTSIGDEAFQSCDTLTSITIPNSVTSIGNRAFQGCSEMRSVTMPDSMTYLGDSAFGGCVEMRSIVIPYGITRIGPETFYECISLTSIIIPNSVTSIGAYAFKNCYWLTSVTIPNSVTSIEGSAFANWFNNQELIAVHITDMEAWCKIRFGNSDANPLSRARSHLFMNGTEITDLVIPNNVTSIGDWAFCGSQGFTSVTFRQRSSTSNIVGLFFCVK